MHVCCDDLRSVWQLVVGLHEQERKRIAYMHTGSWNGGGAMPLLTAFVTLLSSAMVSRSATSP